MLNLQLSRSGFIHLSRWIAAILVVISHLRSLIFVDFEQVANKNPLNKIFYFLTGLGHQSVIVFFVLSGYLIGNSVLRQIDKKQFSWQKYGLNRFTRLYSVLIIALFLTLLFDLIGSKYDLIGMYSGKQNLATLPFNVLEHQTVLHFLSSLFMLQGTVLAPFGSNGPLWSLANEFWYYIIFPLNCILIYNFRNSRFKTLEIGVNVIITVLIYLFLSKEILMYYLVWLTGVAAIYIKRSFPGGKFLLPIALGIFLVYIKLITKDLNPLLSDFLLSIIFMFWLISYKEYKLENRFYHFNEKIASFSYTLYLVHFPFSLMCLTIINNYLMPGFKMQPSLAGYILMMGMFTACMGTAYFIATFTEFKTNQFKQSIESFVTKRNFRASKTIL
jgi:peptidoglycan/LPS O-acetylase OafA/YrhL